MLVLRKSAGKSINIKSSYLHLISDTLSSVVVIVSGVLIYFTDQYWIDPVLTILINLVILRSAFLILRESVNILMQAAPAEIDVDEIAAEIGTMQGVKGVHHLHVWRLDDRNTILEGHVQLQDMLISEADVIRDEIAKRMAECMASATRSFSTNTTGAPTMSAASERQLVRLPHQ